MALVGSLDPHNHRIGPDQMFHARFTESRLAHPRRAFGARVVEATLCLDQQGQAQEQSKSVFASIVIDDRVVDDSIVTFEVVKDGYWPHFTAGQKIEMRLVHIFEMRDGKISKEIVFDMGRPLEERLGRQARKD